MVGYCLKDKQELHFFVFMKEISNLMQREGMLLYTFYGAADLKNHIELNPSNIMQRALQYGKYVSHHLLGNSFHGCIQSMLVGGHYTPSTSWLINRGMDLTQMSSLWKAYVQPVSITMADIQNIFFLDAPSISVEPMILLNPQRSYHWFLVLDKSRLIAATPLLKGSAVIDFVSSVSMLVLVST
ncbi:hypothetical protein R1sor_002083 [Riccia sorocarpa]|uniref:Uncharacterized protein n=1 Tax=Riccia sorocarpa TaxID=122646 RepID=A0ABD3GZR9_9MARC